MQCRNEQHVKSCLIYDADSIIQMETIKNMITSNEGSLNDGVKAQGLLIFRLLKVRVSP